MSMTYNLKLTNLHIKPGDSLTVILPSGQSFVVEATENTVAVTDCDGRVMLSDETDENGDWLHSGDH